MKSSRVFIYEGRNQSIEQVVLGEEVTQEHIDNLLKKSEKFKRYSDYVNIIRWSGVGLTILYSPLISIAILLGGKVITMELNQKSLRASNLAEDMNSYLACQKHHERSYSAYSQNI